MKRDQGFRSAPSNRIRIQRRSGGIAAGAAIVGIVAFIVILGPGATWMYGPGLHKLTPEQQATAIDAFRGRLINTGTVLLAVGVLFYTARNFRLSRESHVTDRFTKAIEQLGSGSLDVRLGAIYALERIMADSPRDHPAIVEVLAAYVREHSPVVAPKDRDPNTEFDPRATDVQAAVTVLGRRPSGREERGRLNLRHTDLTRTELNNADLIGADLTGARLTHANLNNANLSGANLTGANLTDAHLTDADLTRARLTSAHLTHTFLSGANLAEAVMDGTDLTHAYLVGAKLVGVKVAGADLTKAVLVDADLTGARLTHANLNNADLTRANLADAHLHGTDLRSAILTDAILPAGYVGSTQPDPNPDSPSPPPSAGPVSGQV